ncbi:hypothetical protein ACS5PU_03880 [Pedobacter sp. GSP4]|uniref:hypothetical protein n=1 Tax=Pedobacter sp. GSP4 TaxID=3453716 RepID=UPI003EE85FF0
MKKLCLFLVLSTILTSVNAQTTLDDASKIIKGNEGKDDGFKAAISSVIKDPDLYNHIWKRLIDSLAGDKKKPWNFLRDLNIKFKTFQTEDHPSTSLGLSYDFNFDYAKYAEKGLRRSEVSFGLSATGNVAFKKALNPADFLDSKLKFSYVLFFGGVSSKGNPEIFTELNRIQANLVKYNNPQSPEALKEWENFDKFLQLSDQYYIGFMPKAALESNQDFSKKQFAPGLSLDLGAKAWSNKSTLAWLNVFDYPFALIRLITGADQTYTVYGATLPTLQGTIDYVVPQDDAERKNLLGNLDPFTRFKLETSFRTLVAKVGKEKVFLNANLRYYRELGAPTEIKNAGLASQTYFVGTLQSSSGLFVSYAKGKLPFDAKSDAIYSLGLNFKLN